MLRWIRARREAWQGGLPAGLLATAALVLLGAFAYAPLLGGGMILTADNLHAWRIYELGRCLDDGQVPCRWVPDLGNGYGFPLFNYYPPLPYYAGDLLHRLGFSYLRAVDILFITGLLGAGLSMFVLTRRLWGDLGGLVSAVAYVYAPYLALDVYMRGALAELWGLAFAPALLWSVHELVSSGRARFVPLVALFTAFLLLSHNLVALIVIPAVLVWAAALLLARPGGRLRPALLAAAAGVWGLGLAAFFTLPVLREGPYVQLDSLSRWPFHYSSHFVSVNELFLSRSADYGFLLGLREGTPVQIGWFHWAFAGLALPAGLLLWRAGERRRAVAVFALAAFFAAGVFMAVSASSPVWATFDSLRYLQFPWRYMGLVSLASAALAGVWLALLRERPLAVQAGVAAVLIGLFIGSGRAFFEPLHRFDVADEDVFTGEFAELYRAGSIGDYLPEGVAVVPEPPEAPVQVIAGDATVRTARSGTDWLSVEIVASERARVQASLFDYPDWRVRIDGEPVRHSASRPEGLITFSVPAGTHEVEVRLENTATRRTGNLLSLVSWAALGLTLPAMLLVPRLRRPWRPAARREPAPGALDARVPH
jgi:hypothetical protein